MLGQGDRSSHSRHTRAHDQKIKGHYFVKRQSVFLFLLSLGSLTAQIQDYFPLVSGSTWIYRSTNGLQPLTLKIGEAVVIEGQTYYPLDGYAPARMFVRNAGDGNYNYWDQAAKREATFLRFDGREFASPQGECKQQGTSALRDSEYRGPVGTSQTARGIVYSPGICADAGLTREVFVPYLGMVQRAETSIIGERTLELVYAQLGGITFIQEPSVSFAISQQIVDKSLAVKLVLQNRTDKDLTLDFRSGQIFDIRIWDSRGEIVYTWSATRLFPQLIQRLNVRGEEAWHELIPVDTLRPGLYAVEGYLVNSDGKKYSATAAFNLP
jgi:hypothetical protein